ncbi:hypothetical protein STSP2_00246 [Anaerohalosphaera lusitana]|uniref:Uncharacterized protein n=1 Tax=Anaerohalosphaera lusitana TaxID=1936003 RepID=A0A1U9NH26_9BACT|nr:hypothetical protein [Anaerohalosphaera lusitana]AQT67105.1 hypothetical protein STSP2_00246 [Anaerohalosphaera lusitana]
MRMCLLFLVMVIFMGGCDNLRLAATEKMKQNAALHELTVAQAAETAKLEGVSEELCGLTEMAHSQSRAFVADYGMPAEYPVVNSLDDLLGENTQRLAEQAVNDSSRRLDPWGFADGILEIGIGIAGLAGGVWGVRAASFFAQARNKANALKEIIEGNEAFKAQDSQMSAEFKKAHRHQSRQTRKLVAEIKNG